MDLLHDMFKAAASGGLAGGAVGAVIGVIAQVVNDVLLEREVPLQYCYKGAWISFCNTELVQDTKILEDVRCLQKYRDNYASAYDQACRMVQHLINVYCRFKVVREQGKDGLKYIAKFQHAAVRADACWRGLCYAVKDAGNRIASEEATSAMMNIHFTLESLLSEMREAFRLNSQLEAVVAKSPQNANARN